MRLEVIIPSTEFNSYDLILVREVLRKRDGGGRGGGGGGGKGQRPHYPHPPQELSKNDADGVCLIRHITH